MSTRLADIPAEYDELDAFYQEHSPRRMYDDALEEQISKGTIILRCDRDGQLAGFAVASAVDYEDDQPFFISTVLVDTDLRRTGVGSEILNDLVEHIDSLNKPASLKVDSQMTGIIDLYKHFGFVSKGYVNGGLTLMERNAIAPPFL